MKRTLALLCTRFGFILGGCANDSTADTPSDLRKIKTNGHTCYSDEDPDSPIKLLSLIPRNLQIWVYNQAATYGVMDFNDLEAWQDLERRTNVHIGWILPAAQT